MQTRWPSADVIGVLGERTPEGLLNMWDAVEPGFTSTTGAWQDAQASASVALAQGISLLEQKAVAAAGFGVGFRPEVFAKIKSLPGFDVLVETAKLALEGQLDIAGLTNAAKNLLVEIAFKVGTMVGIPLAVAGYAPGIGLAVALVWTLVQTMVEEKRKYEAYKAAVDRQALECIAPGYSVQLDQAQCTAALALLTGPDWRDLFMPEVRIFDPSYAGKASGWGAASGFGNDVGPLDAGWLGVTCCPTPDGARVIAPIGSGIGNRAQRGWKPIYHGKRPGFGLLPFVPDLMVHRAIITQPGGLGTYEAGRALPQLAGLGSHVWGLLWNCGPAAFALDGRSIANAWDEQLRGMKLFVGGNPVGIGGVVSSGRKACDEWPEAGRRAALDFFFTKLGMPDASQDGITSWSEAAPVKAWNLFADYQETLLERVGIAYVDARTCAPEWRARVRQAQLDLLDHPTAVCEVSTLAIPDDEYRAAVLARKMKKGGQCFAVSDRLAAYAEVSANTGPSLAPLSERAPDVPEQPAPEPSVLMAEFAPRSGDELFERLLRTEAPDESEGSSLGMVLGGLALAVPVFGGLYLANKNRRRR
jgi:hypothetical protein